MQINIKDSIQIKSAKFTSSNNYTHLELNKITGNDIYTYTGSLYNSKQEEFKFEDYEIFVKTTYTLTECIIKQEANEKFSLHLSIVPITETSNHVSTKTRNNKHKVYTFNENKAVPRKKVI